MGFREKLLLGFVLLLSGVILCAATQNWLNFSTNETLSQAPQQKVMMSSQLPGSLQTTGHQSNRTEHGGPVSYRIRSHQLWNPAVHKPRPQQPPAELTEPRESVPAPRSLIKLQVRGPDLNPPVKHESKVPEPADSVAVHCGESEVTVEVNQNFLGNGQLIRPSDLTLGGCAALGAAADRVLKFQTELHGCGGTVTMTEDSLVYSFALVYTPTPIGSTFVLKTSPAQVVVECHYRRRHYVSSDAMMPTWKPFASNVLAEQQLRFSLRLMTEGWQSPRPSSVYFPGDVMHIEAAVLQGHHIPLRVFVDSCVATVTPDPKSQPRYSFINNYGCLSDAKLTGAKSYFMQRSREEELHFQLKAFRFHRDHRNSLYITCHLKATTVSVPIDSQHKACSFLTEANRWVASDGDNKVCRCCETSCSGQRLKRSPVADAGDLQWEGTAALGPILLDELTELSLELPPLLQTHEVTPAETLSSVSLLCGVGAALAVVLLVFMGATIRSHFHKPTGHAVCT